MFKKAFACGFGWCLGTALASILTKPIKEVECELCKNVIALLRK